MVKNEYIERLKLAVEQRYKCRAGWIGTGPVKEAAGGKTIWEGSVETFVLMGHPKAKHAYVWKQIDKSAFGEDRIVTMLALPPVDSPQAAVRITFEEELKRKKKVEKARV